MNSNLSLSTEMLNISTLPSAQKMKLFMKAYNIGIQQSNKTILEGFDQESFKRDLSDINTAERAFYFQPNRIYSPSVLMSSLVISNCRHLELQYEELENALTAIQGEVSIFDIANNKKTSKTISIHCTPKDSESESDFEIRKDELLEWKKEVAYRSCAFNIISKQYFDLGLTQAFATIKENGGLGKHVSTRREIIADLNRLKVTEEDIKLYIGKNISEITTEDALILHGILNALQDKFTSKGSYFN